MAHRARRAGHPEEPGHRPRGRNGLPVFRAPELSGARQGGAPCRARRPYERALRNGPFRHDVGDRRGPGTLRARLRRSRNAPSRGAAAGASQGARTPAGFFREGGFVNTITRVSLAACVLALVTATSTVAQGPGIKRTLLQRTDVGNNMEAILGLAEIAPGGSTGRHTHFGVESGYMVSGSASLE